MELENTQKRTKDEDIARAAWKTMTFGKKLEYLWMYQKAWFFGPILLAVIICIGVTMYKGMHTTVLLNAVVIGGDNLQAEQLTESFARYAGIEEKDGIVQIRTNIPDDGGGMASTTALTTLIGAEAVDVLVCPESVYESYAKEGGFLDMKESLGDNAAEYGDTVIDYGVRLGTGSILEEEGLTGYEEIYVAIPVNSQNPEMAVRFVEYLLE